MDKEQHQFYIIQFDDDDAGFKRREQSHIPIISWWLSITINNHGSWNGNNPMGIHAHTFLHAILSSTRSILSASSLGTNVLGDIKTSIICPLAGVHQM